MKKYQVILLIIIPIFLLQLTPYLNQSEDFNYIKLRFTQINKNHIESITLKLSEDKTHGYIHIQTSRKLYIVGNSFAERDYQNMIPIKEANEIIKIFTGEILDTAYLDKDILLDVIGS